MTPGSPTEAQQAQAAQEARLSSPKAVVSREESRTKFENLDPEQAEKAAGETFPTVIDEAAGGPPKLPAGQRITGFVNADTARVELGGEEHGLVQSLAPMAIQTSPEGWSPVDLGLSEKGGVFEAANPLVTVRIPKRLGEGVQAPASGVSLTPVNAQGLPLSGSEGAVDRQTVFFANTQTDSDTVVKPSTFGFAVDTLLRSVESPGQLSFRVGLPEGSTLVQAANGSGAVQVVKEGVTIATIPAPGARDAAGTAVPVSMSASGTTLTLTVGRSSREFQYPIEVDPELEFNVTTDSSLSERAWPFVPHGSGFYHGVSGEMWLGANGEGSSGQWGELYYKTNGDSRIYQVNTTTSVEPNVVTNAEYFTAAARIYLELAGSGGYENSVMIAQQEVPVEAKHQLCPPAGCASSSGTEHNLVRIGDVLTANGAGDQVRVSSATVSISQPKETHSTVSYNTSSSEIAGKANVFYGGGGWIGPNIGAFEFKANDLGIGVAETQLEWYQNGGWKKSGEGGGKAGTKRYLGTSSCAGVQCAPSEGEALDYANTLHAISWSNGEDRIRVAADDAIEHTWSSEHGEGEAVIKFDKTPPHGITVTGIPSKGEELELGEVEAHLKVQATDGEGSVPSSGIKSITLGVNGKEIGKPSGYCPEGPCTATGEWSLNGAELGVGTYTLTVVATDNANNVEQKSYTLSVYHASPVAMGPGSVNPESGDFALGASDVGVSGGAGSLTVTRHYDSRNLHEGDEGPLGPQWTLSLGGLASLEVLPDGSVMVVGPEGLTHFNVKEGGGFEAPSGDSNLTLELKGSEYVLKDATKGTTTKFTLPSGAKSWMPTVSEGPVATDTTTDTYEAVEAVNEYSLPSESRPFGITTGPDGNLWFANAGTGKIGKMTAAGAATEYSVSNGGLGITMGSDSNMWYVNSNAHKIGEITTSGALTEYEAPGVGEHAYIAEGPDGNVWYTAPGGNSEHPGTIGKMTPSGSVTDYSAPNTPETEKSSPESITAGPDGNMWFANTYCAYHSPAVCKIGKISTSGVITEYPLPVSAVPEGIIAGPNKEHALWFTSISSVHGSKIEKITTSGVVSEYSLPKESYPRGITVGPNGDLWFTESETGKIGKITTSGAVSEYVLPEGSKPLSIAAGPDGKLWFTESGTNQIGTISTSGKIVEPKLELAPHPSATCGRKELEKLESAAKGCRALEFVYDTATSAKGENEKEWGEYKGRLGEVKFIAYNPSTKAMAATTVGKYEYDALGRLRAEWNPEISPALRTVYGYDAEGHVTALTAPGQEPWSLTYGTGAGDSGTGRLLKATHAPASGSLWGGEVVKNTEAPKVTGSPVVGVRLAVSNGNWSGSPLTYGYQWEECNSESQCTAILGANNANYTPTSSDVGHTLVALLTATNGGGSVVSMSNATSPVENAAPGYSLPGESHPKGIVAGPDNNLWFVDYSSSKVGKITTSGAVTEYSLPSGSEPAGIASGPDNNLWFTDWGSSKIGKITTSGSITEYSLPSGSGPFGIVAGSDGNLWFVDSRSNKIGKITTSGAITEYALPAESYPIGIATGSDKNLWFTTYWGGKIGKITTSGAITEYALPSGGGPWDIAAGPDGNLWFALNGQSKIGKITTSGAITEYSLPPGSEPVGIASGPDNNLWFTDWGSSKIGKITTSGSVSEYALPFNSKPYGIVTGSDKNLWFADMGTSRIGTGTTSLTEGVYEAPQPGLTIEYNVPLSGSGVPDQMTEGEVAKWGQKEDPVYATAIYPPDEPQSWPATSYKRATIEYMDSQARAVDAASPAGGISTREYNKENAVTRSLSVDNRVAAMNEGCISVSEKECKSAEVAELLDTKNAYNSEGQLTDTWGAQHTVKLAVGKEGKAGEEVLARNHVKYFYNEGAKEVEEKTHETYSLVTKTVDGAETASKEEFDKRTAITSYSGQSNLGWKLRTPTSTTTDPGGLNRTSTVKYEESTGNVIETQTPAASGKDAAVAPAYSLAFGAKGSAGGQFEGPEHDAVDSSGNVWITDYGNHRIQELSPSGTFMLAVGWGVKDGQAEAETCTSSCKAGISGSGSGQFEGPFGIAVNQSSGNLYVADYLGNRVEELSSTGTFVASFGSKGTVGGQYSSPEGVAIDSSGNVWVSDSGNNRIQELTSTGTFALAVGWGVKDGKAEAETCTASCQAGISGSGNGQLSGPTGAAFSGSNLYVSDYGNNRVDEFSSAGAYVSKFGSKGSGTGQFEGPYDIATESTTGGLYVVDSGDNRVQKFTAAGAFVATFGSKGSGNGELLLPAGLTVNSSGGVYVSDHSNNRIEKWVPAITGNAGAHEGKTIYYTAKAEAEVATCREHPEWAGLPCETKPVAQPGVSSLPELPVTTIAYNMWDQPETVTEMFGSTERKKKTTYESSGRPLSTEETSSIDTALPKVTDKYNKTSGMLEEQSTTVGETTKTITSKYNTLGQLETYTDADGNTATFEYEKEKDARLTKMTDVKGNQTYHYDETTGALKELVDSAAGTFKAEYDVAGKMTNEIYPNAMTATYTHNQVGETTGIEYKKTAHCDKTCPEVWFGDSTVPSIHGETLKQASTLSEEPSYTYDAAGRLTQAQEIPAAGGCKTRIYGYDEESNRTSETTREPGTEGKCATEGGGTEWHTYDTANTLADTGVTYDPFGNTTKLPAADAGGSALASEYYVDGQVYKQSQGEGELEQKLEYKLDPEERTRETISSGKTKSTVISHYDASGGAVAWTGEGSGETEKWTRNIPGIDGSLTSTQEGEGKTGKPVVLQVHDLKGNVVATASTSETDTKLLKTYNSTEFGVPNGKEAPPKYAWLGAAGVAGELPSGVITQDGVTYVPQTGRPLQTEGVALPALQNAATPFTRPVEAWVGITAGEGIARELSKAEQEKHEREIANQPPSAIPFTPPSWWCGGEYGECPAEGGGGEEGGGGGGCSGTNACAASVHHYQSCQLEVMVGEEHGKAWSRAWMSCGTMTMPAASYLQTCLTMESGDGFAPVGTISLGCGNAVIGEQHPHRLYANYEYNECPSEVILQGYAKYWMPGWHAVRVAGSQHGYTCGESRGSATLNFVWLLVETFSDKT